MSNNNNNSNNTADHREENESKRKEIQILGLCLRTKKVVEYESDGDINYNWRAWNGTQMHEKKRTEGMKTRGRIETIQMITLL